MKDNIEFINLASKFLNFYEEAKTTTNIQEKFKLWQQHYNFAAVPPGGEGEKLAFKMFQQSFGKYETAIEKIKNFQPDEEKVHIILEEVKNLLAYDKKLDFTIIYFVGFFENNAFVAPFNDGKLGLCLPIENDNTADYDNIILAHELTHIVHEQIMPTNGAWQRPLAFVALQEGLAMKISQEVIPSFAEFNYVTNYELWWQECCSL